MSNFLKIAHERFRNDSFGWSSIISGFRFYFRKSLWVSFCWFFMHLYWSIKNLPLADLLEEMTGQTVQSRPFKNRVVAYIIECHKACNTELFETQANKSSSSRQVPTFARYIRGNCKGNTWMNMLHVTSIIPTFAVKKKISFTLFSSINHSFKHVSPSHVQFSK